MQAFREAHHTCSQRTNKSCTRVGVDAGPTTDPPHFRHTLLWKLPLQRGSYPKVSRLFLKDLRVQQCLCTAQVLPSEPSMSKVTSPPPPWSKLPPYHPLWAAAFAQEPMASLAHIEVERRLAQPPLSPHPGRARTAGRNTLTIYGDCLARPLLNATFVSELAESLYTTPALSAAWLHLHYGPTLDPGLLPLRSRANAATSLLISRQSVLYQYTSCT